MSATIWVSARYYKAANVGSRSQMFGKLIRSDLGCIEYFETRCALQTATTTTVDWLFYLRVFKYCTWRMYYFLQYFSWPVCGSLGYLPQNPWLPKVESSTTLCWIKKSDTSIVQNCKSNINYCEILYDRFGRISGSKTSIPPALVKGAVEVQIVVALYSTSLVGFRTFWGTK